MHPYQLLLRAFGKPRASTCIKLYVTNQEREEKANAKVRRCESQSTILRMFLHSPSHLCPSPSHVCTWAFYNFALSFSQLCTLANSHCRRKLAGRSGPIETPFFNLAWRNWWDDLLSLRWYIQLLQIFIISAKTQRVFK